MLKLIAIGNLGQDAIVRTVNGKEVINFSIAHNDRFTDSQGVRQERTTWVECAHWRDQAAKLAQHLKKGTQVYLEGAPQVDSYIDKSTGEVVTKQRLRVLRLELLGSSTPANGQPKVTSQSPAQNGHNGHPPVPPPVPVQEQHGPNWFQ